MNGKLEPLYTINGNAEWCSHEKAQRLLKVLKNRTITDSAIPHLGI